MKSLDDEEISAHALVSASITPVQAAPAATPIRDRACPLDDTPRQLALRAPSRNQFE